MKAPAFQFYAADFLADKNVLVMSAEEVGAYWLLICVCWREGSLPDDIEELSTLTRVPVERFQNSWERRIKRCFVQVEGGAWVHPRLESERQAQADNREKKRHAAHKRHHPEAVQEPDPAHASDSTSAMQSHSTRNAGAEQAECPSSASSPSTAKHKHSAKAGAAAPSGQPPPVHANGKSPPPRPPDTVWTLGVRMLTSSGIPEREARSFMGGLVKDHGKERVAQAVASTSAQNPVNPQEYLVKVLRAGGIGNDKQPRAGKNGNRPGLAERADEYAEYFGVGGATPGAGQNPVR